MLCVNEIERIDILGVVQILLSISLIVFGGVAREGVEPITLITGGWILITGVLGVCSGVFFAKKCLVGVYLSFSIISLLGGVIWTVMYLNFVIG